MASANRTTRAILPLAPLLAEIRARTPAGDTADELGAYRRALAQARREWLNPHALDSSPAAEWLEHARSFALAHVPCFHHARLLARSPPLLRHAVTHLLRGADEIPVRFARCAEAD